MRRSARPASSERQTGMAVFDISHCAAAAVPCVHGMRSGPFSASRRCKIARRHDDHFITQPKRGPIRPPVARHLLPA